MGNSSSSGEENVFGVVRWIPGIGRIYSALRAVVHAAKGNFQESINSLFGVLGAAGNNMQLIRDSGMFDRHSYAEAEWTGTKQQCANMPENYFRGHLFEKEKFSHLYEDTLSNDDLNLWDLTEDEIDTITGGCTNIPATAQGSAEFSYFNAYTTNVKVTSYLAVYSRKSKQCGVFVMTCTFESRNPLGWTTLNQAKREDVEAVLCNYRDIMREKNEERFHERLQRSKRTKAWQ